MNSTKCYFKGLSDSEIQHAAANIDDFTDSGKKRILNEVEVRGLSVPPSPSTSEGTGTSSVVQFSVLLLAVLAGGLAAGLLIGSFSAAYIGAIIGVLISLPILNPSPHADETKSDDQTNMWLMYDFFDSSDDPAGLSDDGGFLADIDFDFFGD